MTRGTQHKARDTYTTAPFEWNSSNLKKIKKLINRGRCRYLLASVTRGKNALMALGHSPKKT